MRTLSADQVIDILAKSPVFQRINNVITTVYISLYAFTDEEQKESKSLAGPLMLLSKLRSAELNGISADHVLPMLESVGDGLLYFLHFGLSTNLMISTIMKTCRNLVQLSLRHDPDDTLGNDNNLHQDQTEWSSQLPVLHCLAVLELCCTDKKVCSSDMLIALLQCPCLSRIHLSSIEAMTDDVMFNVLSPRGGTALSNVTVFTMTDCTLITEAPFAHWITRENCSLQDLLFSKSEKFDCDVLIAAAEKCPRALVIEEDFSCHI